MATITSWERNVPGGGLPNKMSELLRAAALDAIKTAATPGYRLEMGDWHLPRNADSVVDNDPGGTCCVCLAGSVMVQRLGCTRTKAYTPRSFADMDTQEKLTALDEMRGGRLHEAAQRMHLSATSTPDQRSAITEAAAVIRASYDSGRSAGRACWSAYRDAANILDKAGL